MLGVNGKTVYLLDTVILVGYLNRDDALVKRLSSESYFISAVSVGELYFGAYNSQRVNENVQKIERFIDFSVVLNIDTDIAKRYGIIYSQLRRKGRPIPENDTWIAAIAQQYALTLATRDKHFTQVDGLSLELW